MTNQGQYSGMMENYKGIMLCSRPQDQINLDQHKQNNDFNQIRPFISRVHYDEPVGYNPVLKFALHKSHKKPKPILKKHKQWLEAYSVKMKQKYNSEDSQDHPKSKSKFESSQRVEQPLEVEENTSQIVQPGNEVSTVTKQKDNNLSQSIKKKPQWALSEEQLVEKEQAELDALIDFAKGLDYDSYINDLEVKVMLEALKQRIKEIQTNDVERNKILQQIKQTDNQNQQDTKSQQSKVNHVREVQKQTKFVDAEREEWDKSTTIIEQKLSVEERLAKHIAEEILKQNRHLRGLHSKLSLQRVLEMETQKQLQLGPKIHQ